MRILLLTLFIVLFIKGSEAQINLVPNPSFEDTISIHFPISNDIQSYTSNWYGRNAYFSEYLPSSNSPAYSNTSFGVPSNGIGFQFANSGIAYSGVHTYVNYSNPLRTYIQVKLTDTLESGNKYKVAFMFHWEILCVLLITLLEHTSHLIVFQLNFYYQFIKHLK